VLCCEAGMDELRCEPHATSTPVSMTADTPASSPSRTSSTTPFSQLTYFLFYILFNGYA